jgi:glycosyltransferase involved in cell wall biosynthesis
VTGEKILFVSKVDFTAPRDGGTLRAAAVVDVLRQSGFEVDAFAIRGEERVAAVPRAWGARVRVLLSVIATLSPSVLKWYSPRAVDRVVDYARRAPSIFVISFSQLAPYRHAFRGPVFFELHNVEADIIGNYAKVAKGVVRVAAALDAWRLRRLEARIPRWADGLTVVSDNDADVFERLSGVRATVASNGVSDEAFAIQKQATSPAEVVFIAHLGWRPNIDAAQWIAGAVWPHVRELLPGAVLRLVGRSPASEVRALATTDVLVDGDVASVSPFLARATVGTAPLLAAGGTRLKIIESLASGTPLVATRLGALGLEHLADERFLSIADDPRAFAEQIVRLASTPGNPDLIRGAVGEYRWIEALAPLVAAVREVIAGRETTASSTEDAVSPEHGGSR